MWRVLRGLKGLGGLFSPWCISRCVYPACLSPMVYTQVLHTQHASLPWWYTQGVTYPACLSPMVYPGCTIPSMPLSVGLEPGTLPTTRFTVGLEPESLPNHPFHCWARRETRRETTYLPTMVCRKGTHLVYMPPSHPFVGSAGPVHPGCRSVRCAHSPDVYTAGLPDLHF